MKTEHKIIALSIFFGILVWIMDAILDYLIFYEGTLAELLIFKPPQHEIYIRLLILFFFVIFGIVTSKMFAQRRFVEEALRKYECIISTDKDHMSLLDGNYVYQAVNESYLMAHKRSREETIGKSVVELLGENVFENMVKEKLDECLEGNEVQYESWFEFSGIGRKYMEVNYYPFYDLTGSVTGIVVNSRDATKRKTLESDLKLSEERFRDFFENAPVGFHIFGPDSTFLDINQAELNMTGYSRNEIVGIMNWNDLIIPEEREKFKKHWEKINSAGVIDNIEYTLKNKNGQHVQVLLMASARFDSDGKLLNTRGSVLDITEQKKTQKMRLEQEKLQAVLEIAGAASHELSQPLQVISGYAEILINKCPENNKMHEMLEKLRDNVDRLAETTRKLQKITKYRTMDYLSGKIIDINEASKTESDT